MGVCNPRRRGWQGRGVGGGPERPPGSRQNVMRSCNNRRASGTGREGESRATWGGRWGFAEHAGVNRRAQLKRGRLVLAVAEGHVLRRASGCAGSARRPGTDGGTREWTHAHAHQPPLRDVPVGVLVDLDDGWRARARAVRRRRQRGGLAGERRAKERDGPWLNDPTGMNMRPGLASCSISAWGISGAAAPTWMQSYGPEGSRRGGSAGRVRASKLGRMTYRPGGSLQRRGDQARASQRRQAERSSLSFEEQGGARTQSPIAGHDLDLARLERGGPPVRGEVAGRHVGECCRRSEREWVSGQTRRQGRAGQRRLD